MSTLIQLLPAKVARNASRLGFATTGGDHWKVWDRFLTVDGKPAFHLGNICNTCAFFFERKDGASSPLGVQALARVLEAGVQALDLALVDHLATAMPLGSYDALLLRSELEATIHGAPGDYFSGEQLEAWGPDGSWNPEVEASTAYYRAGVHAVAPDTRLFEFVMPMLQAQDLDPARIDHYCALIADGHEPTALAISVLDAKTAEEQAHWCLAHYLLDGHHKVEAAVRMGRPITLISFLAHEKGVSSSDQIAKARAVLGGRRPRR